MCGVEFRYGILDTCIYFGLQECGMDHEPSIAMLFSSLLRRTWDLPESTFYLVTAATLVFPQVQAHFPGGVLS